MARPRRPVPGRIIFASLIAAAAVAVSPLTAIAANKRVNTTTGDVAPRITQGDPHVAGDAAYLMAVFNDPAGLAGGTWSPAVS